MNEAGIYGPCGGRRHIMIFDGGPTDSVPCVRYVHRIAPPRRSVPRHRPFVCQAIVGTTALIAFTSAALMWLWVGSCCHAAFGSNGDAYSRVLADWSKREAETKSLSAEFTIDEIINDTSGNPRTGSQIIIPPRRNRVLFSSDGRVRSDSMILNRGVDAISPEDMTTAFNKDDSVRRVIPVSKTGEIRASDESVLSLRDLAIGLVYRGTSVTQISRRDWKVESDTRLCDGVICTGISLKESATNSGRTYWVDLLRDSLPMRYELRGGGENVLQQVDLHYDGRGSLRSWECWSHYSAISASKVDLKVNPPIDDSEFVIDFPPGYCVTDVARQVRLESLGNRRFRPWRKDALQMERQPRRTMRIALSIAVLVVLVMVVYWRRRVTTVAQ